MSTADTKTTILDAAEVLLAEQGFAATTLRQLTAAAGVNLAAVHYHFGSKEELAKAVLARRIEPINAERLRRLAALPTPARLPAIVRAFVEPPLRASPDACGPVGTPAAPPGVRFCRVFGRIMVEQPPFLREFLAGQFRELARRFAAALAAALPGHDTETLWWRLHFVIGAMAHTLQNSGALSHLSDGRCNPDDLDEVIDQLVTFAVGGFTAGRQPASAPRPTRQRPTRQRPRRR
ncbi:MAG: TetR family transcriptional regulator [Planctomycetes bacterium]|nr:TetR family transcriptional regulator [Planctomycetota bacterium]